MSSAAQKFESITYCRKNLYAMMMSWGACSDYVAARCCLLNGLFSGIPLSSHAVEKMLKSFIFLKTAAKTKLKSRNGDLHNPFLLKEDLKSTHPDSKLDSFDELLKKLFQHYQSRYYDNTNQRQSRSPRELPQIDELFVYLLNTLPIPDEVKYNTYFFQALCNPRLQDLLADRRWALQDNPALQSRLPVFESIWLRVGKQI